MYDLKFGTSSWASAMFLGPQSLSEMTLLRRNDRRASLDAGRRAPWRDVHVRVKDWTERALSLVLLLLALPMLLATAMLVASDSRGGVLFRQHRVGRDGQICRLYKFRTMRSVAGQMLDDRVHANEFCGGTLFKMRRDPRVTRIGRWLRRTSLDELPQLWNVVRGEMSLVGPRPPLPHEVATYSDLARRRLLVKPGLTGLWQVSGRSNLSWEESLRLDLYYVENWSLALDAKIIARTPIAVLSGSGAY